MELRVTGSDGNVIRTVPMANIESLSLLGSVQISTQAIAALADMNTPLAFLSPAGRLVAIVDPLDSISAEVRRAQVRRFDQPDICLDMARALISAKISNQRTLLLRNCASLPKDVAAAMAMQAKSAAEASSLDAVRGHEGQAAAIYFAHFAGMLKSPLATEFDVNGRKRRPPPDPVNSCLSLAYSMLTHECVAALRVSRLEPSIGGFHVSRPGRPALALDLMEPFRPLIADSVTIACFNRGELSAKDFVRTTAGCLLSADGRRSFFEALGRRMSDEITHPAFKYRLSYRRMIVLHARMIAAWLMGEFPSLSFLTTR
jgi:CRISPR-associated protein Cas1